MADALWWRIRGTQRLPPCPLPPLRQIHLSACGSRTLPTVSPNSAGVCIRRCRRSCAPASASFGDDRLLPVSDDGTSPSQAVFALCLSQSQRRTCPPLAFPAARATSCPRASLATASSLYGASSH